MTSKPYRRRWLIRIFINLIGHILFPLLTRTKVTGKENILPEGPLILAANHRDTLDIPMLVVFPGRHVEVMGTTDVPLPFVFQKLIEIYGYVPIKRGEIDRNGLNQAMDILQAGGVMGIFPEGGLWESDNKKLRHGVAWLSMKTNAPIIPIGLSGTENGVNNMITLKRPRLTMNMGRPIYPRNTNTELNARQQKQRLEEITEELGKQLNDLIPEEYRSVRNTTSYELQISDGDTILYSSPVLGQVLYNTKIVAILQDKFHLQLQPLQSVNTEHSSVKLTETLQILINYAAKNPKFFEYRLGRKETGTVIQEIQNCQAVLQTASRPVVLNAVPHEKQAEGVQ